MLHLKINEYSITPFLHNNDDMISAVCGKTMACEVIIELNELHRKRVHLLKYVDLTDDFKDQTDIE